MALVNIREVSTGVRLGLWRMDEEPEELFARYPHLLRLECPYKYSVRRKEFFCVRALLLAMTGDPELRIEHAESGRPFVVGRESQIPDKGRDGGTGWEVSISHTKGYAVLMLSSDKAVGVDIEYRSDRVAKIASHYIRPDEMAWDCKSPVTNGTKETGKPLTTEQMLVLWCAKETLYKLHSDDNLAYFDMRATGFTVDGELLLENMKRGTLVKVHIEPTADYVLTWAVEENV